MKGLSLSQEMALAWHEGRKTVTRRPMRTQPAKGAYPHHEESGTVAFASPCTFHKLPYRPGETVYIKETWQICPPDEMLPGEVGYPWYGNDALRVVFLADNKSEYHPDHPEWGKQRWRPSTHLSERAARSHALIVSVTPERVQEITHEDAIAEGVEVWISTLKDPSSELREQRLSIKQLAFSRLWDSIYAKKGLGWDADPWVWRIKFEKVNPCAN